MRSTAQLSGRLCPDGGPVTRAVASTGVALLAVYVLLVLTGWPMRGGALGLVTENGAMTAGAVLAGLRARRDRRERLIWTSFAAAIVLWMLGNLTWELLLDRHAASYPSAADGLWLASYVPVFAGLALLARVRVRQAPATLWLDGLIGGLAVAAVGAVVVLDAVIDHLGGDQAASIVNVSYPGADLLVLLAVAVVVGAARQRLDRSWLFVAAAFTVFVSADSVYLVQDAHDTYVSDHLVDAGWPLGLLLLGLAACQRPRATAARARRPSIAVPIVLAVAMVVLLVIDHFHQTQPVAVFLSSLSLVAALVRLVVTQRETDRLLDRSRRAAMTDALTGLPNRRALLADLGATLERQAPAVLAIFDLNGFKSYNDTFGHPAGDALLTRLGQGLAATVPPGASAYRMGGDEFCLLTPSNATDAPAALLAAACDGLTERGQGFEVSAASGHVLLPREAQTTTDALSIADRRLYADKNNHRVPPQRQSSDVLLRLVAERDGALGEHIDQVTDLAARTAAELGLEHAQLEEVLLAAELHDIGKAAIPDRILRKKGPLSEEEWTFMRRHTIVGERILSAAPSLAPVARIVRSTHEWWNGDGYPDGLAGEEIPLAARIVFVCDVFDAMTRDRPYREGVAPAVALDELVRHAGSQFDPVVVDAFARAYAHAHTQPPFELRGVTRA